MKKRLKIISIVTSLCLCLTLLLVGVYAASSVALDITSTIQFTSNGAYVMATGQVYRGTSSTFTDSDKLLETDRPDGDMAVSPSYSYKGHSYEPVSSTDDTPNGSPATDLPDWTIGAVELLSDEPYIKYEIVFKNYGESTIEININGIPSDIEGVNIQSDSTLITIASNTEKTFNVLIELTDFRTSFENIAIHLDLNIQKSDQTIDVYTYTYSVKNVTADYIKDFLSHFRLLDDGIEISLNGTSGSFQVENGSILTLEIVESQNLMNKSYFTEMKVIQYAPPTDAPQISIYNTLNDRIFHAGEEGFGLGNYVLYSASSYTVNGK